MIHFILFLICVGLGAAAGGLYAHRRTGWIPARFIAAAAILSLLLIGIAFYAFEIEPNSLTVTRTGMDVEGLDEPITIVFIADHHFDVTPGPILQASVDIANAEDPDYILLGGDYVSGHHDIPRLSILGNLSAKKGVYAVLGNHDYMDRCADDDGKALAENVTMELEGMGIDVLRNDAVNLTDSIVLAGVDDYYACEADYGKASGGTGGYPVRILLAHNQVAVPQDAFGHWDLVLFSHTHCGQVRLPIIGSVLKHFGLRGEYDMGHYDVDGTHVYSTCGIGGYPLRFLAPPEVSVLELY